VCTQQKTLTGSLTFSGDASSLTDTFKTNLKEQIATKCGVPATNVDLSVANAKTVVVTFTIYVPDALNGSGITIATVTVAMTNSTSLLEAVNTALASVGLTAVASVAPFVQPTSSPSPSPSASPSTSHLMLHDSSKKDSGLSSGAIAGIVIGSVVGAVLIVGLIVFLQMKSHTSTKKQHASATAKSLDDAGKPLKSNDQAMNNRL